MINLITSVLGQYVTRQSLLTLLRDRDLFKGSISSLGKILKDIGFCWKKDNPRRGLMELHHVALARIDFLQAYVNNMRSNHYQQCVYLDETWIFENGSGNYSWQDSSLQTVKKLKSEGKRLVLISLMFQLFLVIYFLDTLYCMLVVKMVLYQEHLKYLLLKQKIQTIMVK